MRHKRLEHRFVEHIPEILGPGVLYVSMEYATAVHSCCCGCGEEVVTPFTPTDWKMTFDGEAISLKPSVGNWNLACRSHYVIDRGQVIEADPWTDEQVEAERRRDKAAKARYYGATTVERPPAAAVTSTAARPKVGFWRRAVRWLGGGR
ncbi:hypothetical protein FHT70_005535 [Rhizobium sp. BK049]|nr:DUF6527 family protein [Rhizobium sp. BK049]MBB3355572.1 hypothetical protein [Rhizobium sp. BK049]